MSRSHIWVLGLVGCTPELLVAPSVAPEPLAAGSEPVARGTPASGSTLAAAGETIPASREWCGAVIDTRPRPLPRTSSFLLAWNEIRIADGHAPLGPIPLTEADARIAICGSVTCQIHLPVAIEFSHAGELVIGTVLERGGDVGDGLLVIPDISPFFADRRCPSATQIRVEPIGDLVRVSAEVTSGPPRPHHGYNYHHYDYCYSAQGQHDVFVDLATGEIELEIEHRSGVLGVEATNPSEGGLHVTLTGCDTTLELAWTQ